MIQNATRVFRRRKELCFPSSENISQSVAVIRIPTHARKQNERARWKTNRHPASATAGGFLNSCPASVKRTRRERHPRTPANGTCIRFCTTKCGRIKASTDAELALLPPAYLTLSRVDPTQQTLSRTALILITLLPPSYSNDLLSLSNTVSLIMNASKNQLVHQLAEQERHQMQFTASTRFMPAQSKVVFLNTVCRVFC